ncbi:MAG: hypothetical protein ACREHD_33570, partial [Pirellulales bacterium]
PVEQPAAVQTALSFALVTVLVFRVAAQAVRGASDGDVTAAANRATPIDLQACVFILSIPFRGSLLNHCRTSWQSVRQGLRLGSLDSSQVVPPLALREKLLQGARGLAPSQLALKLSSI